MGMMDSYSASYFSIAGPDMEELEMGGNTIVGSFKQYGSPQDSRSSELIKVINPFQIFPQPDTGVRAFATAPHSTGRYAELTATELYKLILAIDMGLNFYARENNPMLGDY
jgi:hypothetical protein